MENEKRMLTTHDGTKLGQSVVTDVNAPVALPASEPRKISREAALLFDKSIVARPLMVPEVCSLRVKNSEYQYRWVNRDGQGGRMYTQRRAQGFINATTEDVEILGGDAQSKDGEIRAGDLVLMKIRGDLYDAAIKWNMQKAVTQANMRGVHLEGASSDIHDDSKPQRVSVADEPFNRNGKAVAFIPSSAEAEAMISDSIKAGRADEARKAMESVRNKAEK